MFPISTSSIIEGKKITANDGIVVAWQKVDADSDDESMQKAWDNAIETLNKKTKHANANGIVNLTIKYTSLGDGSKLLLTMVGTAVSVSKD